MKEVPTRRVVLPDAHPRRPAELQGYPDQRKESSLPQIVGVNGKPQLYGRVAKSVQSAPFFALNRPQSSAPKKLHFNQDGIKRGRVAHVGEFFRRKHVYVAISGCK